MFPELATVFHPNEAEALLPSAHALEKRRKRQRKIMIVFSIVLLSLGLCAITIGVTLFFFASKGEASERSGISPDWARLPPEVASAIHEYNAAVAGYNYDGEDKGKSESERPIAIVESWLPAHGALNWPVDDDDKVNFTLMETAARTVVIGRGYDNFTKPSTSALLVAEFESTTDSRPNASHASAIFIFNPLVVRNFDLDVPVASTSMKILPIECVPEGIKQDRAGVTAATKGYFSIQSRNASCSLEHMQQACKFEYNTESEFVPANVSMETEPCPAGAADCGVCRVRTYLEDVCAVIVKVEEVPTPTPPYAPADRALRSCYYPFDGLDERSFKYVINPLFNDQQHLRDIQERERKAFVKRGNWLQARHSWITTLSLRYSTDPFISLQRLTKGNMVFLAKDGNPYDPRRDDKGDTESDRDNDACDRACNKTRRRIGSILIYIGTPLLVLGLLGLVVTFVKLKSKKEVAK